MIGKLITVTVDRPMGSHHPDYPDLIYPINYGYIEGILAADGEEQDAYVLGVNEPISEFCGRVIAVIHRHNGVEDKLVVAADGLEFTKNDILRLTHFQERYFDVSVEI